MEARGREKQIIEERIKKIKFNKIDVDTENLLDFSKYPDNAIVMSVAVVVFFDIAVVSARAVDLALGFCSCYCYWYLACSCFKQLLHTYICSLHF